MSTSFRDSFFGTKDSFQQTPTLTPQQQQLINQLIGGLGGPTGQGIDLISQLLGGNQEFLKQLQAPEIRRFEEQTIPGLAERFSGAGAQESSAFKQALGGAGAGLSENLAAQSGQLGMQAQQTGLQGLLSMLGLSQKPQFATSFQPGKSGALGGLFGGIGQGLGGISSIFNKLFGGK